MNPLRGPDGVYSFVFTIVVLLTGIFGASAMAFWQGRIGTFFSHISDAGSIPPQSGLLALSVIISSISGSMCIFIRHVAVIIMDSKKKGITRLMNNAASICGIAGVVGFLIAVSFPLGDRRDFQDFVLMTLAPHLFGLYLGFLGVSAYFLLHLVISFRLGIANWKILTIRSYLGFIIFFFACFLLYTIPAAMPWVTGNHNYTEEYTMTSMLGMYTIVYMPSAYSEWFVILAYLGSGLTHLGEMKGHCVELSVATDGKSRFLISTKSSESTSPAGAREGSEI